MKNEDEAVLEWGRQGYVMGRLEEKEQWEIKQKWPEGFLFKVILIKLCSKKEM